MNACRTSSKPTISPLPPASRPMGTPWSAPAQCAERGDHLRRAYAETGTCVEIQLAVLLPCKRRVAVLTPGRRKDDGHGRQCLLRRLNTKPPNSSHRHSSSGSYEARLMVAAQLVVTAVAKLAQAKKIGTIAAAAGESKRRAGNSNRGRRSNSRGRDQRSGEGDLLRRSRRCGGDPLDP